MREPSIGDFSNPYDNTVVKNIDILDDGGTVENTIVATEWFAELCFAGWWRVNADWLEAQAPPEPPADEGPTEPPEEPEPLDPAPVE